MDGIFGVGLAELIIIGLALFIIGGPENSAKWARELGRTVRKVRTAWAEIMADMEQELGPEGKELMDVTRELNQAAQQLRSASPARHALRDATRLLEDTAADVKSIQDIPSTPVPSSHENLAASANDKYSAWKPPDQN